MNQVIIGDQVPALTKHCTLTSMIAYAGATWDWHRLHYDHEYLESKGLAAPVVDGQVFGAYVVQAIQDWLGESAFISELDFRYAGLVFAEEYVQVSGEVTAVSSTEVSLLLKIDVVEASGAVLRPAVTPITAKVVCR
uniref:MaoC/PaaZ C-terminal domain-containing protein n=2 Tax=Candidatus Planktophila sp. TaxID=2175601 RepID=UPI00404AE1EB